MMEISWQRRIGYALKRRWRIVQGFARFYASKLVDGLQRFAGRRLRKFFRWSLGTAAVAAAAALVLWGPGREPAPHTSPPAARLPVVSGMNDQILRKLADRHQLRLAVPVASAGGAGARTQPAVPVASAGRAGAATQPAVPVGAVPQPAIPEAGEARPAVRLEGASWPADGPVISGPGWRRHPVSGHWHYDPGVRLMAAPGGPVRAVLPGTVAEAGRDPDGGLLVAIEHGGGLTTVYGNLEHVMVAAGQRVSAHAPVGMAPLSPDEPVVRFAIYQDGEAIDPLAALNGTHP
ncbi:MAG TPA: M23 family metallopeptidase [Limnochordales bacterium]